MVTCNCGKKMKLSNLITTIHDFRNNTWRWARTDVHGSMSRGVSKGRFKSKSEACQAAAEKLKQVFRSEIEIDIDKVSESDRNLSKRVHLIRAKENKRKGKSPDN